MQYFWWRNLWPLLPMGMFCLLLWIMAGGGVALLAMFLSLLVLLGLHLRQLKVLMGWLNKPDPATVPDGFGVWDDAFSSLYQEFRLQLHNESRLKGELGRLQQAARALPDGVVMLNVSDQIEWCNPPAEGLLGLDLVQDAGQPISFLVRQSEFISYLNARHYGETLTLKSARSPDVSLQIQLVPFGDNQKLLICRDVSHLEKIETMRRDFVANVSHELRTPLTVVGGFIETLKDMGGAFPESLRHYFDLMEDQTNRMRHLVEDLLTLSQLESSQQILQEELIDIPALVETVRQEGDALSGGRHRIVIEDLDRDLRLRGSQNELHSAFGNLVTNAIRYTPAGGEIRLVWKMREGDAVFSVADCGIGIEPQHISRLTERFYRVDRSRSRETGGTGLGLSIVKHILSRHQGHLEVSSEYGKGSIFSAVFSGSRIAGA